MTGNKKKKVDNNGEKLKKIWNRLNEHNKCTGSFVILLGFAVGGLLLFLFRSLIGVGLMGICVFAFTLIGANILSQKKDLTTGEVRRAIAISCISVFFGLLTIGNHIKTDNSIIQSLLKNFWWIVITIIGFYFGGRSAENVVNNVTRVKAFEKRVKELERKIKEQH